MKHSELFGIFSDPIECIPNPVLQGLGIKKRGPRRRRGPLFFILSTPNQEINLYIGLPSILFFKVVKTTRLGNSK